MEKLIINGPCSLHGEVQINGAKNSAIAILPATLLIPGKCTLHNVPNIVDVQVYCNILKQLGSDIKWITGNSLIIDNTNVSCENSPIDLTRKFRASYYLLGSMLGRCGSMTVGIPGGCQLGARPIDQHIKGFEALGATVSTENGNIVANASELTGTNIYMDIVSVGATINIMLTSVLAKGLTTIENAAKEPHVVDVANFLNSIGADVRGAGTDIIKITGVSNLKTNATYSVVPDQIEAGTFMFAAVATKGDLLIKDCIPEHLDSVISKILEIGGNVEIYDNSLRVWCNSRPIKANLKTLPYPGFPTDLQPQIGIALALAEGTSIITESIWDSRFQYTQELIKMGAKITVQGQTAVLEGVEALSSAPVYASDLRAGASLIIAGLCANGQTELYNLNHIDRGYENIEDKFRKIGADIKRVKE